MLLDLPAIHASVLPQQPGDKTRYDRSADYRSDDNQRCSNRFDEPHRDIDRDRSEDEREA